MDYRGFNESYKKRDNLFRKYKNNPENLNYKRGYTQYRNALQSVIKRAKISHFKRKFEQGGGDSKSIWQVVESINKNNVKRKKVTGIRDSKNNLIEHEPEMADLFNEFFSSVGPKLAEAIRRPKNNPIKPHSCKNSLFLVPVTNVEIRELINALGNNKSPGIDGIKSETLKRIVDHITLPLTHLINNIMIQGIVPKCFKIGIITPLFKSGDREILSNYRPITLISNVAKVFEKALKNRLVDYLEKYKLISVNQFGFRKGISTQDAITSLTSKIHKSLENGKKCLAIFLDLAKAFDTVHHRLLLDSLRDVGIRGKAEDLMKSYLDDREQCVRVDASISGRSKVEYGVPQGTVIGPILFIIYMNNLLTLNTEGSISSFADDAVIFYESQTWEELKRRVEGDFAVLMDAFGSKILTINFDKTCFLPFSCSADNCPDYDRLSFGENNEKTEILGRKHVKYLGIIIDSHLRWNIHIDRMVFTLRSLLCKFRYLKQILDLPSLKTIYYALVESKLTYGNLAWGTAPYCYLEKVEKIQKKFLKIIMGKSIMYPSDELYRESKILDMRQLYFLKSVIDTFGKKRKLNYIDHQHNTRSKVQEILRTQYASKTISQRASEYLADRLYNYLPLDVRKSVSAPIFKRKVRLFLVDQPRHRIASLFRFS